MTLTRYVAELLDGRGLYTFVENTPLIGIDPDGLMVRTEDPTPVLPHVPSTSPPDVTLCDLNKQDGCKSGWESQWDGGSFPERSITRKFRCHTVFNVCQINCSVEYEDLTNTDKDCVKYCKKDCLDGLKKCIKGLAKNAGGKKK